MNSTFTAFIGQGKQKKYLRFPYRLSLTSLDQKVTVNGRILSFFLVIAILDLKYTISLF